MLLQNKKIAIVGGGPGGLTLAKLLQLQGVDVRVYERDFDKHARVQGSPLDLHDESGLMAITKAGLLNEFQKHYMPGADRMQIMDEQAKVFFSDHETKPEADFGHEHFRPEISRGVLRKLLLESLSAETIQWDSHFMSMEAQNDGWLLHFKNGKPAYADIVVAADGANSKIRPYITDIRPYYTGITMLEGNIYDAAAKAPTINTLLRGGKIMAFGKQKDLLMGQKGADEIGFYASFRTDENWASDSGLDYSDKSQVLSWFKKKYPEWANIWYELFDGAETPFIPRPIYCMPLDQGWISLPNVTLLGDAAHVMPPFAGEGVNMAMRDAVEVCESLTSGKYHTLLQAITGYETDMRRRAQEKAQESLENGARMHADDALETMLAFFGGYDQYAVNP